MQLDSTRIVIRERSFADILDLSLRVTSSYFGQLARRAALVTVPLMLLNDWLVGWMVRDAQQAADVTRYLWTMGMLVFFEAPLMSVLITLFLGKALFLEESRWQDAVTVLRETWFSLAWCQLLLRSLAAAWWCVAVIGEGDPFGASECWLIALFIYTLALRAGRPFINEIILLERNPLRSQVPGTLTIGNRSTLLHGPSGGKLVVEWFLSAALALLLVWAVVGSVWFIRGTLFFDWSMDRVMLQLFIPMSMWIVASYLAVVRFMCYLDLRIRREGWEVLLLVRAASDQLRGTPT